MEKLQTSINLLKTVITTLDTISVAGIENQDRFVGCASAINTVVKSLEDFNKQLDIQSKEEVHSG